jgi:hypothetical protein
MQYLVTKMTTVLFCVVNSRGAGYMEFFYRLAERKYFYLHRKMQVMGLLKNNSLHKNEYFHYISWFTTSQ